MISLSPRQCGQLTRVTQCHCEPLLAVADRAGRNAPASEYTVTVAVSKSVSQQFALCAGHASRPRSPLLTFNRPLRRKLAELISEHGAREIASRDFLRRIFDDSQ